MNTIEFTTYPEIPLQAGQVAKWKDIPIKENGRLDPLVPLGPLSQEAGGLLTSSTYYGEYSSSPYAKNSNRLTGSLLTLFARQSVARRLLIAEQLLPADHHLLIVDAYRSVQVQKSLYDFYKQKLGQKKPDLSKDELDTETQKYVSLPSTDAARPSPHNTGGAVDVVIVKFDEAHEKKLGAIRSQLADKTVDFTKRVELELQLTALVRYSTMLNFGTAFDHGGEKSALSYYENKIARGETLTDSEIMACNNRRLLFSVMTQAGFQSYFAEWWHFNAPESQMGAATAGLSYASLGAATLSDTNTAHEHTRHTIHEEAGGTQRGGDWPTEIIAPPEK